MRWNLCILLFIFSLASKSAFAKDSIPKKRRPIKTLNIEQGLLNNATTDIITDKLGFTWISTFAGLQRYNGYRLETIIPVVGKDSFRINYPVYFFALKSGSVWISFKEGILSYDPASNSFTRPISAKSSVNVRFSIIPLQETRDGIWCMEGQKGIVLFNHEGKLIKTFPFVNALTINNILNSEEFLFVNSVTLDDSCIYINNPTEKTILCVNTINQKFRTLQFNERIISIATGSGKLYLLFGDKLVCMNPQSGEMIKKIDLPGVRQNLLMSTIKFFSDGRFFGAINGHLYQFDPANLSPVEITDIKKGPILQTGFIQKIYHDGFRRIWLLTNNDVKRIQDRDIPFDHFLYANEKNNFVKALYYDKERHQLLAGCFNGGLQLYDTNANPLWKNSLIDPDVKDVLSIEKLDNDQYLVITYERGWYLLNIESKTIRPFSMPASFANVMQTRKTNFANNVQRINDSIVLVTTSSNIFRCIFYKTHLLSVIPLLPVDNNRKTMNCTLYTRDGNLWAGSQTGEIYFFNRERELKIITIPGKYVIRTFAEDEANNIWVGTDIGLYTYSSSGVLKKEFTKTAGLLNDCIYSILPVKGRDAVFIGSNLGLSYISMDQTVKNFVKEMGLQENEFNTGSAVASPDGKLYFGGINGISSFYPSALNVLNDTPLLHITRLVVNDSLWSSSASTWKSDTIVLSYKQQRLRFDLAATGMLNANEYVYKYRLRPFENEWQSTLQPQGINYTLQPGTYVLEVQFFSALSTEQGFTKNFFVIIHPPWWQLWWFRIIAAIIATLIIAFIVYQYNRRRYQKKIQVLQVQQQIQQEKERISRELHDDLGTTANMLAYNSSLLDEAHSAQEMQRLKTQIKEASADMLLSLRETAWTLKQEKITVEDAWTRLKNFITKMQRTYSLIDFKIVEENSLPEQRISYNKALNIIRILQEAINNAVKHAECTDIVCKSLFENGKIFFSVKDNGKGTDMTQPVTGSGLQNMQHRAKESGMILEFDNEKNKGTLIRLQV